MSAAKPLTAIPTGFGSSGAGLFPNLGSVRGAAVVAGKKPDLEQILTEHRAAILALQSPAGVDGALIEARFASVGNVVIASNGLSAVDGVTPLAGDIALLKDQTVASENGIYQASAGAWTRLVDDAGVDITVSGMLVTVSEGTVNADRTFMLTTNAPITVGSTSLVFTATDQTPAKGADLGDTAPTITVLQGKWRRLPAATLTANRIVTLGTSGAKAGDEIEITRLDLGAFTLTITDGGSGTPVLFVMAVSKLGYVKCRFDGTNWFLKAFGVQ